MQLSAGDSDLLAQYGPRILSKVDFTRGRVRPSYSLDASAGVDLYSRESKSVSLQVQSSNLTNRLNVINFANLFSGTAVAAPRCFAMRLKLNF